MPQRRSGRYILRARLLAECGMTLEERCLMVPPVALFQDELSKESVRLVASRHHVPVARVECEVRQRERVDEFLDRLVAVVPNRGCETVLISDSSPSSELRSSSGVASSTGQSACGRRAIRRTTVRRGSRVAAIRGAECDLLKNAALSMGRTDRLTRPSRSLHPVGVCLTSAIGTR